MRKNRSFLEYWRPLIVLCFGLSLKPYAQAITIVRNGGNGGDLELNVSKNIVMKTLQEVKALNEDETKTLCSCPTEYADHPHCKNLDQLTQEQQLFCGKFIHERAAHLSSLLQDEVRFMWTEESLSVSEVKKPLAVDALTSFKDKTILINKDQFLRLESYERNFLLAHESFHLTEWKGQPVSDEQKIGPFTSETGGRELLNAAANALVIKSNQWRISQSYQGHLNRSRQDKKIWISADYSQFKSQEDLGTLYIPSKYKGGIYGLRYFLTDQIGLGVYGGKIEAKDSFLQTIDSTDTATVLGAGLYYKWAPFENKMSFFGQSFLQLGLKFESWQSKFKLVEDQSGVLLTIADEVSTTYPALECSYYIPMIHGFWLQATLGYSQPKYSYKENIDAQYSQGRVSTNIGVSYAF